jgi:hypothetical protein
VLPIPEAYIPPALNLDIHGKPLTYRSAKNGPDRLVWERAEADELIRLLDTQTIVPIKYSDIPKDRLGDIVYYNPVVKQKRNDDGSIKCRVRGTAGGDRLTVPYDVSARTASLETVKMLIHSIVSSNKKWRTLDIADFYLGTPLPPSRYEYIRISLKMIPTEIMKRYQLYGLEHSCFVYFEIRRCMYGLPQAGRLSQIRLIEHLARHGYRQCPNTPCLFRHRTRDIIFSLVVDDFGVRYGSQSDIDHLEKTLQLNDYKITIRPEGDQYLGMKIAFNTARTAVTISMPGYVQKMLTRFRPQFLDKAHRPARTPGRYIIPIYGKKSPQLTSIDASPRLPPEDVTELQAIIGTLLYYARAVDPSLLPIANELASKQAQPTAAVMHAANRALSYCAGKPNMATTFHACGMILIVYVDASYLSRSNARSVVGCIFFLGNEHQPTRVNGTISAISTIIPCVVASAGEAEYAALFTGGQHAAGLRTILADLGYPQPPTTILCDNTTAIGLANDKIKMKRSKAIDMRFHWIRDRVRQNQFYLVYIPTKENIADYMTKNLPKEIHDRFIFYLVRDTTDAATQCLIAQRRL